MAKTAAKSSAPKKTSAAKPKASTTDRIGTVSEETLQKLRALNIEPQLQQDLEWCLGSYRADNNPIGLYAVAEQALTVLQAEKEKKTKGVTSKLIEDLTKALKDR
jgi:hypothetical protein